MDADQYDNLALAVSPTVARARELMAEHQPDPRTDRCAGCVLPQRLAPIWPCATWQLAKRADELHVAMGAR